MARASEPSMLAAVWPAVAAGLGALLLAAGLLVPNLADPAQAVTPEQAQSYYEAAAAVEKAAANDSRRRRSGEIPESAEQARELQAARNRFDDAKQQVAESKQSKQNVAWWLKVGGFACVVIGAGGLLSRQS